MSEHDHHDDPAHPWTVAGLAARVGVSRASLARRFTDLVGRWRHVAREAGGLDALTAREGVFIDGSARALHDSQGVPNGFLKIGQDVTERHEAEERLRTLMSQSLSRR